MMLNTNRLLIALIVGFAISPFVQAQLKTFKPGDVIKSSEINENFEYLEEQIGSAGDAASAQCSATQDGSNVVISCTDGSFAVLAGAGTVVAYPEGVIGEAPLDSLPSGEVVWVDATGTVLAKVYRSGVTNYVNFGLNQLGREVVGHLINLDESQEVVVSAFSSAGLVYFIDNDCGGTPYSWDTNFTTSLLDLDGRLYTQSAKLTDGTLMRGLRKSGAYNKSTGVYTPTSECIEVEQVVATYSLAEFTPAQEILNAVYPVRLEQLP